MSDVMRQTYRPLTPAEKAWLQGMKDCAAELYDMIGVAEGDQRSFALAKTKIEEAVMWATKGFTG